VSSSDEFSVTLPAGYLVNKDARSGRVSLVGSAANASFEVAFEKNGNAKESLKEREDLGLPTKGRTSQADIDDSRARLYQYQSPNIFRLRISLATKKGFYVIDLAAPTAGNETFGRMVASLRLNGKRMLGDSKVETPVANTTVRAETLDSSDIVRAATSRKQSEAVKVDIVRADHLPEDEVIYSQPVIVADYGRPTYNDRARSDNIQGIILARILFKGNGNIGKITIIKGLSSGLNEQVVEAVKRIKFVPAKINGVPVDAEKTLDYRFTIY
jgi:protein TonB